MAGGQAAGADFKKLRLRLELGLLAAFSLPVMALAVYFHFQFNPTLRETGKLHLASLAESQRNTIDLFLQERVTNIFSLFPGASDIITLGKPLFENRSLTIVGPGNDGLGEMRISKSGLNSKTKGNASSTSSGDIFEPVVTVLVLMSCRSANSSRRNSNRGEDAMLPHLKTPIFVVLTSAKF